MNPKITKKHAIVLVVALIALFIIIVGGSYAFFTNTVRGKEYVVYSGTLAVSYEKKTNVVNLNNTKPMTNTEGLATTAYSFDVKNTGTIEEKYQVRLEEDVDNTLPLEYVKISVYKNDTELLKPIKLSDLNTNLVIGEGTLDSLDSDNYKVRLWVDINTPNDMVGKEFKGRIVIDAMQDVAEGFDVNTRPIITLNKDSNNNTNLILNVGDTYTELGVESVRDDKDNISLNNVAISGTVNTNVAGIYTVTYSVTDSDNNTSTTTRTVAVNDGSIPVYKGISNVLASFTQTELTNNETVICDHIYGDGDLYFNCETKNTIDNAIAARTSGTIIVTKNITRTSTIMVAETKDIILELNGKTIERTTAGNILTNNGTLVINDGIGSGKMLNSMVETCGHGIFNFGTAIINSGTYESKNTCAAIYSGTSSKNYGTTIINDGNFIGAQGSAIIVYSTYDNSLIINGGTFNSETVTINKHSTSADGIITINGGTFVSNTNSVINNGSTGTINIIQKDNPIYMLSLSETWKPVVYNNTTGTINITANQANACTSTASDTTSGLCLYAEGNKNYAANTANGALQNQTGIVNINGGTYYGGHQGLNNGSTGTLNIKNANVLSDKWAVLNNSTGTVNICSSALNGVVYDIYNSKAGFINYNDITTTNATPNIYNPNGTVTQVATCPIVD